MNHKGQILEKIVQNSHATIIEVPSGYGFEYAKKQISFPNDSEIIDFFPTIHNSQKTELFNVDDIENLQSQLRSKSAKRQFVVFHAAQKMNEPAQNKFLKLLEEPRNNLNFILLADSAENFLQTIRSRAQIAKISKISNEESEKILDNFKLEEEKRRQILFLANGLPAELEKLSTNKKYFSAKVQEVDLAKKWLSGSKFEKMIILNSLKSDREKALGLISQILNILKVTINEKTAKNNTIQIRKLLSAYKKIEKNGNIRIVLLEAILSV